jgi:hypothetical protein
MSHQALQHDTHTLTHKHTHTKPSSTTTLTLSLAARHAHTKPSSTTHTHTKPCSTTLTHTQAHKHTHTKPSSTTHTHTKSGAQHTHLRNSNPRCPHGQHVPECHTHRDPCVRCGALCYHWVPMPHHPRWPGRLCAYACQRASEWVFEMINFLFVRQHISPHHCVTGSCWLCPDGREQWHQC